MALSLLVHRYSGYYDFLRKLDKEFAGPGHMQRTQGVQLYPWREYRGVSPRPYSKAGMGNLFDTKSHLDSYSTTLLEGHTK